MDTSIEALPGLILTSNMTQKVATAHKMKLRQKTTFLSKIPTVISKPRIGDKEWWFSIFWQQYEDQKEVHFWSIFHAL